ncbi:hypothetical protein XAC3810_780065 [Xanthomonas citri pv. citri]|nr:hypothetical protein XAC908_1100016 [Xanthomonas citri pv. citri]CEE48437.1 hypothetical protein XAC3810_780065 [Xanthomonas citri pv. citri]CEE58126.1 hypothetical protein XAC3608_1450167 [Xanthomonas citri pv. citri]CEE74806.1 hypothetical protein XAC71A_950017 [Xanthomonas citri pv. citri]CEE75945.1 hypothetical protein XACLE20_1540017 [Xanthomonas citri pv. citri]
MPVPAVTNASPRAFGSDAPTASPRTLTPTPLPMGEGLTQPLHRNLSRNDATTGKMCRWMSLICSII